MRALAIAAVVVSCASPRAPVASHGPFADATWIAGSWRGQTKEGVVEELWSTPSGGVMLGVGRIVKDDRLVLFEFLRIEARGDKLVYIAQPRGGAPTEFVLAARRTNALVFANAAHDFPRTIEYRLEGDTLVTHLEGEEKGARIVEETTLHRAQ